MASLPIIAPESHQSALCELGLHPSCPMLLREEKWSAIGDTGEMRGYGVEQVH